MDPINTLKEIQLRQPDDWHLHLRDGDLLNGVVGCTANVFRRAIIMPNLSPPITTLEAAIDYKKRILESLPQGLDFSPLMTLYLTEKIAPSLLEEGYKKGILKAVKLYPANATTNSEEGVRDLNAINPLLETMERIDMPLLIHGEVMDPKVDIFDREEVFIDRYLGPLLVRFPGLRVVLEHITTQQAADFVGSSSYNLAATITPHHLHINRNSIFNGGLRSDFYCLPVAKREKHRLALRKAVTSGKGCFFLGTDSAPHRRVDKQSSCGCAGIFNAPNALESYAQVFHEEGALDKLEAFSSEHGPSFYRLPVNKSSVRLVREQHEVPLFFEYLNAKGDIEKLVPFHAGEILEWKIVHD